MQKRFILSTKDIEVGQHADMNNKYKLSMEDSLEVLNLIFNFFSLLCRQRYLWR